MKTLLRTLTLSAAALAALVAAPKSEAQQFRHGETFRGGPGYGNHGYGYDRGYGGYNRGYGGYNRGYGGYGRGYGGYDRGYGGHNWGYGGHYRGYGGYYRGYVRPPSFYGSPFRVYAGSRFYSYCPGPDYVYVDELGWVFPPFIGAVWVPRFDRFGVRIGGFWR